MNSWKERAGVEFPFSILLEKISSRELILPFHVKRGISGRNIVPCSWWHVAWWLGGLKACRVPHCMINDTPKLHVTFDVVETLRMQGDFIKSILLQD